MKKVIIIFLLTFFIGNFCQNCWAREEKPKDNFAAAEEYYLKGKEFLKLGDYEQANECFRKAQNILDVRQKAQTWVDKNKQKTKKNNLLGEYPFESVNDPQVMLRKAKDCYLKDNLDEAIFFYDELLKLYPRSANIYWNLGVVYLKKQDYDFAMAIFEKVASLNNHDKDAYYNLAVIHENILNNKKKALEYYNKYAMCAAAGEERTTVLGWIEDIKSRGVK